MAELAEVLKQVKAHGPGLSSAVLDQEAKVISSCPCYYIDDYAM
jgi:hypothetical protein